MSRSNLSRDLANLFKDSDQGYELNSHHAIKVVVKTTSFHLLGYAADKNLQSMENFRAIKESLHASYLACGIASLHEVIEHFGSRDLIHLKRYCSKSVLLKKWELLWGNKEVPQIFLLNSPYSRKYKVLRLTQYQFVTSHQIWVCKNFSLWNAMFDEDGKRILLKTAILFQTKFIGGVIRQI